MQKHRIPYRKVVLPFLMGILFIIFIPLNTWAAAYFFTSTGGANPATLSNWSTNSSGIGGSNPASFATNGDIFNIRPSAIAVLTSNWILGGDIGGGDGVILNDSGSLTINSGFFISVYGKKNNNSSVYVTGTIIFQTSANLDLAVDKPNCIFQLNPGATFITANVNGVFGTGCSVTSSAGNKSITIFDVAANYEFNGSGQSMTGIPVTVNNLVFSNSGTKTFSTVTTINGNFTVSGTASTSTTTNLSISGNLVVGNGASLTADAFVFAVTGTTTIGGGASGNFTISSATGAKTFTGLVTVVSGATWNNSVNQDLVFNGGITNNGTFTSGTGIHTFNTNNQAISGILSIPNVTVTGIILTNNNTFSVGTSLAGTGTLLQATGATMNIGGSVSITTLTVNPLNNTVNYNGTGAQTVQVNNFYNLTISANKGAAATTLASGTIGIAGTFSVTATNTSYTTTGNTVNYNGTNAQTIAAFNYNNLTISGNKAAAVTTLASSGTIGIAAVFSVSATNTTYTLTGSTIDYNGTGAQTIVAFNYNNLTLSGNKGASATTLISGTVGIAGTLSLIATNTSYVISGNTIDYNGTGAQTIVAFNYNNLTISGNKGAAVTTLASSGTIGIAATFSVTATNTTYILAGSTIDYNGTSAQTIAAFNYNNLTISGNKGASVTTLASSGSIGIAAVFSTTATNTTYTVTGSTVNYNGSGSQTITPFTYNFLVLSNAGTKSITVATFITCFDFTINNSAILSLPSTVNSLTVTK